MIAQNVLLEYMTKGVQSSQAGKQAFLVEKAQPDKFKDTFNQAMDKAQSRRNDLTGNNKYHIKKEQNSTSLQERERFNTFKAAERERFNKVSALKTGSSAKNVESANRQDEDTNDMDDAKKVNQKSREDILLNTFANILGMDSRDLVKLLNSMNIDRKDLSSLSESPDTLDGISRMLGLDSGQKQLLGDILDILNEQLGALKGKDLINPQEPGNEMPESEQSALTVAGTIGKEGTEGLRMDRTDSQPELIALMTEFKSRLEELAQKLSMDPQGIAKELTYRIKNLMEQAASQDLKSKVNGDAAESLLTDVSNDKSVQSANLKAADTNGNEKQNDKTDNSGDGEAQSDDAPEAQYGISGDPKTPKLFGNQNPDYKTNNNNAPGVNGMVQNLTGRNGETEVVTKIHKDVPVSRNELFNQIIDKAKVITSGERSEMIMELKPESLGKLSLKVVTENGIVTAKFIAENQQVKEVIESNMQLLKDSLEKQGLSVQGFSVSVGQQSSSGHKGEGQSDNNRKIPVDGIQNASRGIAAVGNTLEELERSNPYNWSESSINLTA
jgi:flagellar hook-length control protein FliK